MHAHADGEAPVQEAAGASGARRAPWRGLPAAIAFLTIVPVPGGAGAELAVAAGWFPLVGAAAGALAGGVRVGAQQLLGRTPASVLAVIALVVVTGALHQDGLADTADGLGARGDRARRLQVMRDPATGVFGTLALIGWALLLASTLASLDASRALVALVVACALARWAALAHTIATPPARAEGLGAALRVGKVALALATVVSVVLALALCGLATGAGALLAALLLAALSAAFARRTLGGRTGDTLGASVALAELAVCVALLAIWHA
ncbi:MAG TPA: adenosylcobinamide-GDP ribazoletransferase [Solirubrobacteraceae bacterium]|nr:adenosylcobinamide-GDP ribazoletransferase [Solirubrobacteraceae bacterium]